MKKTHLLIVAVVITAICITQQASAKIWRVNNKSNYNGSTLWGDNWGGTATYPVFAQVDDAINFAFVSDGDTIYIEGSTDVYSGFTVTKKLVFLGTGYFLTFNVKVSNNLLASNIDQVVFNSGSKGSSIEGINIGAYYNGYSGSIYINENDITVKRCRIEKTIAFASGLSDVYILGNFFSNSIVSNCLDGNGTGAFVPPSDIIFNNNVCQKTLIWSGLIIQCNNNIFDGPSNTLNLQFLTDDFKNNILKATNATVNINNGTNKNVSYNIGTLSNQFGTTNHNLVVSNISTLFVSLTSPDGIYQLKKNSQGSNNGSDGTDRGAFGGASITDHYTLSGLAPIPVIYAISTLGVATQQNGLPVTISARTIK